MFYVDLLYAPLYLVSRFSCHLMLCDILSKLIFLQYDIWNMLNEMTTRNV